MSDFLPAVGHIWQRTMESRRGGRPLVLIEVVESGLNGLPAAGASDMMLDNSEGGRFGCARR